MEWMDGWSSKFCGQTKLPETIAIFMVWQKWTKQNGENGRLLEILRLFTNIYEYLRPFTNVNDFLRLVTILSDIFFVDVLKFLKGLLRFLRLFTVSYYCLQYFAISFDFLLYSPTLFPLNYQIIQRERKYEGSNTWNPTIYFLLSTTFCLPSFYIE